MFIDITLNYRVELLGREKVSTPEKMDRTVAKLSEVSMCSTILHPNDETTTTSKVNETAATDITKSGASESRKTSENILFDIERVKKAGHFLEDCRLFLSGFSEPEIDKFRLAVQTAGGVSLSQLTPSVTHMVIKNPVDEHFNLLSELKLSPYKVTIQWIVESMLMGRPVPEEDFVFHYQPPAVPKVSNEEVETQFEDDLLAQYKSKEPPKPKDHEETELEHNEDEDTQVEKFLTGKKLYLTGLESEQEADCVEWVTEAGGEVVSMEETGQIDYLITGLCYCPKKKLSMTAKEILTYMWLDDCFDQGILVPTINYHKPIMIDPSLKPCDGVVIGLSNYSGRERTYIAAIGTALGMVSQEVFAKREKNGAKKNTHLVCKGAQGNKYEAAVNWKMPVVSKDWLVACLKYEQWVSEEPFLVGKSTVSTPGKPHPSELEKKQTESKQEEVEIKVTKESDADYEDDEIVIKQPTLQKRDEFTPVNKKRRLSIETPEVDLEKLRPHRFDLDASHPQGTPSNWAAGSEPSFAGTQATQATQSSAKRKRFDNIDFAIRGMATPETPYGAFASGPNPSPRTRKFFKKQCDELGKFQLPEDEIMERRAKLDESVIAATNPETPKPGDTPKMQDPSTPLREKWKDDLQAKGVIVLSRETRRFSDIMEEKANKLGKSWKEPGKKIKLVSRLSQSISDPKPGPLNGVVVYVAKKLDHQQKSIQQVVANLGGQIRFQYCGTEVTHMIFSGKQNDITKEFRTARDDGKWIVSPEWIKMCNDENRRVEEKLFPHSYNPKMSLSMSITETKPKKIARPSSTITKPSIPEKEEMETQDTEISAQLAEIDNLMDESKLAKEIEKTDTEETPELKRRRSSLKMRLSSVSSSHNKTENQMIEEMKKQAKEKTQIMWLDPSEEEDRQKLAEKLGTDSQQNQPTFDSMEMPENLTELINAESKDDAENKENGQKIPCFTFSNFVDDSKDKMIDFLESQGAKVTAASNLCEPDTTHIIAQKISRSEKMLGSIASGKWILHPSYLDACMKEDKILTNYEDYEWGNPEKKFLEGFKEQEKHLGMTAHRWRKAISKDPSKGPFSGIRAIIHTNDSRKGAFARLMLAGKGIVIQDAKPPYKDAKGATHCLAEPKKLPNQKMDFEALAQQRVAVVGPLYINEFLITDPPPKVEDFILEDYKSFWNQHRQS